MVIKQGKGRVKSRAEMWKSFLNMDKTPGRKRKKPENDPTSTPKKASAPIQID